MATALYYTGLDLLQPYTGLSAALYWTYTGLTLTNPLPRTSFTVANLLGLSFIFQSPTKVWILSTGPLQNTPLCHQPTFKRCHFWTISTFWNPLKFPSLLTVSITDLCKLCMLLSRRTTSWDSQLLPNCKLLTHPPLAFIHFYWY